MPRRRILLTCFARSCHVHRGRAASPNDRISKQGYGLMLGTGCKNWDVSKIRSGTADALFNGMINSFKRSRQR